MSQYILVPVVFQFICVYIIYYNIIYITYIYIYISLFHAQYIPLYPFTVSSFFQKIILYRTCETGARRGRRVVDPEIVVLFDRGVWHNTCYVLYVLFIYNYI